MYRQDVTKELALFIFMSTIDTNHANQLIEVTIIMINIVI